MKKSSRTLIWALLYFAMLIAGIVFAFRGHITIALFLAITCAGESVAVSIDRFADIYKSKDWEINIQKVTVTKTEDK